MAFASHAMRRDDARMPVAGVLSPGLGLWQFVEARGLEPLVRRATAASLALLCCWLIFVALAIPMAAPEVNTAAATAIDTITLAPPRPQGPAEASQAPAGGRQSDPAPQSSPGGSVVDVSTPPAVIVPEWSVSRIRIAASGPNRATGARDGTAAGNATGQGGAGVYDPYAGATPMRLREVPGLGPAPDPSALGAFLRRATSLGLLRGGARCDLLIALTGAILEASCRNADGETAEALARLLAGEQLYGPSPNVRRTSIELPG